MSFLETVETVQGLLRSRGRLSFRVLRREFSLSDDEFEDLELDSLRLLTLAVEVENRFRICLDQEDEANIRTVSDLMEIVHRKLTEKGT